MRRLLTSVGIFMLLACSEKSLYENFQNPPQSSEPWCYYMALNGHFDKSTIDADVARMDSIGFGGVLFTDISGYHDGGEEHLNLPKRTKRWMSEEWLSDLKHLAVRLHEHDMHLTMNVSAHGGSMKGPWDNGADSPKMLVYNVYRPSDNVPAPELDNYKDIATFAIRTDERTDFISQWYTAAGGPANLANDKNLTMGHLSGIKALETRLMKEDDDIPEGSGWVLLRVGYGTIPGYGNDLDVLDKDAVRRYLVKISEILKNELGDLFGSTLTHYYSVSWEGSAPTWSINFAEDFRKYAGYDIIPYLPALCGFEMEGKDNLSHDFRVARNEMFLQNFYKTMADVSHEYGLKMYSESGGPWTRTPEALLYADQQRFLAVNDMPQGEFWLAHNFFANTTDPVMHVKGTASAAHVYGKKKVSAEAFTHMTYHWSTYPYQLKTIADMAFIDGCNHMVWHTYTSSPSEFGVPGLEYFAGTHINRNVIWQKEAGAFLTYLSRCQFMLQQGLPVSDLAVWAGNNVYQDYGAFDRFPYNGSELELPQGYPYDIMNSETLLYRTKVSDGRLVLPDGMSYSAIVVDPESADDLTSAIKTRLNELSDSGIPVIYDKKNIKLDILPDVEGPFKAVHRRNGDIDIYFVTGTGKGDIVLRASSPVVQVWDPVSGVAVSADYQIMQDGRTSVKLNLPENGSTFIIFGTDNDVSECSRTCNEITIDGPWNVSFKYHEGITATPPSPRIWESLHDLTEDEEFEVRHFSGEVTMTTDFDISTPVKELGLGHVLGGLAKVYVNDIDCGTIWTAPWSVDVSDVVKKGMNTLKIVYSGTWSNRMIGDCKLPEKDRVTTSNVRIDTGKRQWQKYPGRHHYLWVPTVYSRYMDTDRLVPSGIAGPITVKY